MFLLPPAAVARGLTVLLLIVNKISHASLQIWQQCQLGPQKMNCLEFGGQRSYETNYLSQL